MKHDDFLWSLLPTFVPHWPRAQVQIDTTSPLQSQTTDYHNAYRSSRTVTLHKTRQNSLIAAKSRSPASDSLDRTLSEFGDSERRYYGCRNLRSPSTPKKKHKKRLRLHFQSLSVSLGTSTILDDFLYIGAKATSQDTEALERLGVRYIVNVTQDVQNRHEGDDSFHYLRIPIPDTAEASFVPYLKESYDFINEAKAQGGRVLVHCTMGMSRSCSVVLAYLMECERMSLAQALIHMKERRPVSSPNPGFMKLLIELERTIFETNSVDLEKYETDRFGDVSNYIIT